MLIEKSELDGITELEENSMGAMNPSNKEVIVEAVKCLCNITYNSEAARMYCAETDAAQSLVTRLRIYKDIQFKDDIMLFDMKLLFILTALRQDIRLKVKELHGMDYLTSCLNELVLESSCSMNASCFTETRYFLQVFTIRFIAGCSYTVVLWVF